MVKMYNSYIPIKVVIIKLTLSKTAKTSNFVISMKNAIENQNYNNKSGRNIFYLKLVIKEYDIC